MTWKFPFLSVLLGVQRNRRAGKQLAGKKRSWSTRTWAAHCSAWRASSRSLMAFWWSKTEVPNGKMWIKRFLLGFKANHQMLDSHTGVLIHSLFKVVELLFVFVCLFVSYLGWTLPGSPLLGWEDCALQQLGATWALQFRLRQTNVCTSNMNAGYLPVSGPLDFRLVIQVLLRPCMIFNACIHRRHPCLTPLAEGRGFELATFWFWVERTSTVSPNPLRTGLVFLWKTWVLG